MAFSGMAAGARCFAPHILIALNIIAFAVIITHRCITPVPDSEYVHRLVGYEAGLIRRGLVGDIYSRLSGPVSGWAVRIEGLATIAAAIGLFAAVFARAFQLPAGKTLLLGCFLFGSPLLFKNFIGNLGKFDVLGAMVAMAAVLVPLRAWAFLAIFLLSVTLLFVHHLHATVYVPVILAILLVRMVAADGGFTARQGLLLVGLAGSLAAVFFALLVLGVPSMAAEDFLARMRQRASEPFADHHVMMWYSTIGEETARSLGMLTEHLKRAPLYAAFVAIHLPVAFFLLRRLRQLWAADRQAHAAFMIGLVAIVGGFLITNVVTFDYARHLGNLAMALLLLSLAQILAVAGPVREAEDLDGGRWPVLGCAALVSALPWTGVVFPLI